MITKKIIAEIKKKLVETYNPIEIYLFGSYAWGTPHKNSDLDILIVVQNSREKSYKRSIKGSKAIIDFMVPNDIIVYTKKEFENKSKDVSTLCYKISKEGKIIYARA
jgi:uncharacterized protein